MADIRRIGVLAVAALTIAVTAVGCGVSPSSPSKLGDGIAAGQRYSGRTLPDPDDAVSPTALVLAYLSAAAESGSDPPLQRLQRFLTANGRSALNSVDPKSPWNPTVIRVLGAPSEGPAQEGSLVDVRYEVVGVLTDRGQIDAIGDPATATGTMQFSVKTAEDNSRHLRIDAIKTPAATIMLSDAALNEYYQVQPVYFWDGDGTNNNSRLIPDIRYVPYGLDPAVRANRIVNWIVGGPSGWLGDFVQRLPSGTALKSFVIRDGRYEVNLSAQAAAGLPAIQRLYRQLQWSLQSDAAATPVDLSIEDKLQTNLGSPDDYRAYDLSWSLATRGPKYDIVDGKVTAVSTLTPPPVLAAKDNAGVYFAAFSRNATLAVVRQRSSDRRFYLQIVRDGAQAINVYPPTNSQEGMGRPVWVSNDVLLVPSGGRLYSVTADGSYSDLTPPNRGPITQVTVSPDARRIAFVANGQAVVASLNLAPDNTTVKLGSTTRDILKGVVSANAVAWASEGWLYVAGRSASGAAAALWWATGDGVVGLDKSSQLAGVTPTDMVAYPTAPFASVSVPEVLLYANSVIYQLQGTASQDGKLKAPFFGM